MGTPAYMSPEQTSGRSLTSPDIFSLGVVLHEMARGGGRSRELLAELASAILRDTPPSVTDVRSDLPSDLGPHHPALLGEGSAAPRADGTRRQQ